MFKLKNVVIVALVILLGHVNCIRNKSVEPLPQVRALTSLEKKLIEADNLFSWNLFKKINETSSEENLFISPLSASLALGMTYNGAAGETGEAMKNVLNFSSFSSQQINETYKSLIDLLSDLDPNVQFNIANSIWYRLGLEVEQNFIDLNRNYFNAEISGLDFNDPQAVNMINSWVDEKTNRKIEKILDSIDPYTVMFLINAIYFNGTWLYEFDKNKTKDDNFYLPDGSEVTCKLMRQGGTYNYLETETYQAVELPYGQDKFRMTVFLPKYGTDLNDLVAEFNSQTWNQRINQFTMKKGSIFLPKFKLEYKITLNEVLKAMGMAVAFDPARADFTNISNGRGLFISNVLQKAFVEVDEVGTEAAAVTVVEISLTSANPGGAEFLFRADHPFLFVIWENHSNTVLFIGKIVNPNG